MKRIILLITTIIALATSMAAQSSTPATIGNIDACKWVETHFATGKVPPFSFKLNGMPSRFFIAQWKHMIAQAETREPNAKRYLATYAQPGTGLTIVADITAYTDFPIVEWLLYLENTGNANTHNIAELHVVDLNLQNKAGDFTVRYNRGGESSRAAFTPRVKHLQNPGDCLVLQPASGSGRSSDGVLPFFNIDTSSPTSPALASRASYHGVICAVGWTGEWRATVNRTFTATANVQTGQSHFNAYLKPGERIRTPRTALLFWQGSNPYAGNNIFRRYITAHKTQRMPDGKPVVYPLSMGFEGTNSPRPCDCYDCLTEDWALAMMRRHRQFGLYAENYWIDAGWDQDSMTRSWWRFSNWNVDTIRFPRGLMPISQEARKHGATLMVWFEPERCMWKTPWRMHHPEWMLHFNGKHYTSAKQDDDTEICFLNLTKPEVVNFVSDSISSIIEQNGIGIYRQDFNWPILACWRANDEPGREGITEAKYIEGLYQYWDNLLARCPGLKIDNCAAGGRRIDLETTARSCPMWRTDYLGEPLGEQCHTYGANLWLPQSGTVGSSTATYDYRSNMGSPVFISWRINSPQNNWKDMQVKMKEVKWLRHYFREDYYPLCGIDDDDITSNDRFLAYEFFRPCDGTGVVLAFRRPECQSSTLNVKLYGLDANETYIITNRDTGTTEEQTGRQLMTGYTLTAAQPHTSILLYLERKASATSN